MSKNLIIYYSRAGENYADGEIVNLEKGNTELAAEIIRDAVGAELFKVETVKDYPADYMSCTEVAKKEFKEKARPELKAYLDSVSEYENIVVAGPCWWGTYPCAIFSQLEKLDFSGKKVFALMTHEGSGQAKSVSALRKYCKGAKVGKGIAVKGSEVDLFEEDIAEWAKKNLG